MGFLVILHLPRPICLPRSSSPHALARCHWPPCLHLYPILVLRYQHLLECQLRHAKHIEVVCKPDIKNQSARGAENVSAEATGAIGESASCHINDCGVQDARQNYVEIVSSVMGAMCCQPAKTYGTLSSRQFRYTLPLRKRPDLVSLLSSQCSHG